MQRACVRRVAAVSRASAPRARPAVRASPRAATVSRAQAACAPARRSYATAAAASTSKEASNKSLLEMSFRELKHDLNAGRKFVGIDDEDEDFHAEPEVAAALRLPFAREVQSADISVQLQHRFKHHAPPKGSVLSPAFVASLLEIVDRSPSSLGFFLNNYGVVQRDLGRIANERAQVVHTAEGPVPAALWYHPLTVLLQFQLDKLKEDNARHAAAVAQADRQAEEQLKRVDEFEARLKDLPVEEIAAKHPEWQAKSEAAAYNHLWFHHTLPRADDGLPTDPNENFEPDDGWAPTDDAHDDHGHGHGSAGGHH